MTSEDEFRGDQPTDWTHGGRDKGRGYSGKKGTSKKSSKMFNERRFF